MDPTTPLRALPSSTTPIPDTNNTPNSIQPTKIFSLICRLSDRTKAILKRLNILNAEGDMNPPSPGYKCPPAQKDQIENLTKLAETPTFVNHLVPFKGSVSNVSILRNLVKKGKEGIPRDKDTITLKFSNFEAAGSAVLYKALGLQYLKEIFLPSLIRTFNPQMSESEIQASIDEIFIPEYEQEVIARLGGKLNDFDTRFKMSSDSPNPPKELLEAVEVGFVHVLQEKDAITPLEMKDRPAALTKIKDANRNRTLGWINVDLETFDFLALKYGAFTDSKVAEDKDIAMVGLGNPLRLEFFCYYKELERTELARSVRLSLDWIVEGREVTELELLGDDPVGALIDFLCCEVRVTKAIKNDIPVANSDDLKMAISKGMKGEYCATRDWGSFLNANVRGQSKNLLDKTVKKIVEKNKELRNNTDKIFPHFITELIEEITKDHFQNDPYASIVAVINLFTFLDCTEDEFNLIIQETKKLWLTIPRNNRNNPLYYFIEHIANSSGSMASRVDFLSFLGYLACHNNQGNISIKPFDSHDQLLLDISIPSSSRKYHVYLNVTHLEQLYDNSMHFLRAPKKDEQNKNIRKVINVFFDATAFERLGSSPLIQHPKTSSKTIDLLLHSAESNMKRQTAHHPLLGLFTILSLQSLCSTTTITTSIYYSLLPILSKWNERQDTIWDALNQYLVSDNSMLNDLRTMINNKPGKEYQRADEWVCVLANYPTNHTMIFDLWINKIAKNSLSDTWLLLVTQKILKSVAGYPLYYKLIFELISRGKITSCNAIEYLENDGGHLNEKIPLSKYCLNIDKIILTLNDVEPFSRDLLKRVQAIIARIPKEQRSEELSTIFRKVTDKKKTNTQPPSEKPVESKPQLVLPTKESQLTQKIRGIERLVDSIPDEAAYRWLRLLRNEPDLPLETANPITKKIVLKFRSLNKLNDILDFLSHSGVLPFYKDSPFFLNLMMQSLEGKEKEVLEDCEDKIVATLSNFLKGVSNKLQLEVNSYCTFIRIFDHLTLDWMDIPLALQKLFKASYLEIGTQLVSQSKTMELLDLFKIIVRIGSYDDFLVQFHVFLLIELKKMCDGNTLKIERNETINHFLESCTQNETCKKSYDLYLLMKSLAQKQPLDFYLVYRYLTYINRIYVFNNVQDFEYLSQIAKQFIEKSEFYYALKCFEYFTGKLEVKDSKETHIYLSCINYFIHSNRYSQCMDALLSSPLVFDLNTLNIYIDQLIQRIFEDTVIKIDLIHLLIKLIEKHPRDLVHKWVHVFKKALEKQNSSIYESLWNLLSEHHEFHKFVSKEDFEILWLHLLMNMHLFPQKLLLSTIKTNNLLTSCKTYIPQDEQPFIYQTYLESLLAFVKQNKLDKSADIATCVIDQFSSWLAHFKGTIDIETVFCMVDIVLRCDLEDRYMWCYTLLYNHLNNLKSENLEMFTQRADLHYIIRTLIDIILVEHNKTKNYHGHVLYLTLLAKKCSIPYPYLIRCLTVLHESNSLEARKEIMSIFKGVIETPLSATEVVPLIDSFKKHNVFDIYVKFIDISDEKELDEIDTLLKHPKIRLLLKDYQKSHLLVLINSRYYKLVPKDSPKDENTSGPMISKANKYLFENFLSLTTTCPDPKENERKNNDLKQLFSEYADGKIRAITEIYSIPRIIAEIDGIQKFAANFSGQFPFNLSIVIIRQILNYLKKIFTPQANQTAVVQKTSNTQKTDLLIRYAKAFLVASLENQKNLVVEYEQVQCVYEWLIILMSLPNDKMHIAYTEIYKTIKSYGLLKCFRELDIQLDFFFDLKMTDINDNIRASTYSIEITVDEGVDNIAKLIRNLHKYFNQYLLDPLLNDVQQLLPLYAEDLNIRNKWAELINEILPLPFVLSNEVTSFHILKWLSTLSEISSELSNVDTIYANYVSFLTHLMRCALYSESKIHILSRTLTEIVLLSNTSRINNEPVSKYHAEIGKTIVHFVEMSARLLNKECEKNDNDSNRTFLLRNKNLYFELADILWRLRKIILNPSVIELYMTILKSAFLRYNPLEVQTVKDKDFEYIRRILDFINKYESLSKINRDEIKRLLHSFIKFVLHVGNTLNLPYLLTYIEKFIPLLAEKNIKFSFINKRV
jgi:hypothetical protein